MLGVQVCDAVARTGVWRAAAADLGYSRNVETGACLRQFAPSRKQQPRLGPQYFLRRNQCLLVRRQAIGTSIKPYSDRTNVHSHAFA